MNFNAEWKHHLLFSRHISQSVSISVLQPQWQSGQWVCRNNAYVTSRMQHRRESVVQYVCFRFNQRLQASAHQGLYLPPVIHPHPCIILHSPVGLSLPSAPTAVRQRNQPPTVLLPDISRWKHRQRHSWDRLCCVSVKQQPRQTVTPFLRLLTSGQSRREYNPFSIVIPKQKKKALLLCSGSSRAVGKTLLEAIMSLYISLLCCTLPAQHMQRVVSCCQFALNASSH